MVARILFFIYNSHLIKVDSFVELLSLCYRGIMFDTSAILYVNGLFVVLNFLPLAIHSTRKFQKFLFYLYFSTNFIGYFINFIDFIYYRYTYSRSTLALWESVENETNKLLLLTHFVLIYWHVLLLYIFLCFIWLKAYQWIKVRSIKQKFNVKYVFLSLIGLIFIVIISVAGIRGGDLRESTRPINLVDANRYVSNPSQSALVLNSTFSFLRTIRANNIKKVDFIDEKLIPKLIQPIKQYNNNPKTKPNIVIFILESFSKEYNGSCNKYMKIKDYVSYTPFVDSLANHGLLFYNAYSNGYKSIHGMSSVLSGIPSFKDAFTSSPFAQQKIESLVSVLKNEGYDTSFFHGAPNGSMGFLGYSNILGFDHYYGKTEFNNDKEYDGIWGIWDEPFFLFMKQTLDKKEKPFFATLFSVSSHDPYNVPEKYKSSLPKGKIPVHQPIAYTDQSLKKFFEAAKKTNWYNNTIFVFVADHSNLIYYQEYAKELNFNAIPILFYLPNKKYVGEKADLAQQIDIYPTLLDMIGYEKPFRSWGRSLVDKNKKIEPFVIRYSANVYQYMKNGFVLTFDGIKTVGLFKSSDWELKDNVLTKYSIIAKQMELECKAYLQDYMQKIVDRKLGNE
jgi:phosphoglycerol transferase MdoB-like AlkP superfamily enzyme